MNGNFQEMVSVVIPSRNRPQLANRAVTSALAQTLESIEVIVVVDGPDEATVKELEHINDPRLKVVTLPVNIGPAGARNAGVAEAKGTWIAFLDDDDEWLPQKLERQLEVANNSKSTFPVVVSCFFVRTREGETVWPKRLPKPFEPLSEYLFVRNSLFYGEGFIQTSTFFIKKELMTKVPLKNNLRRHEDWDWLLEVNALEDVKIEFISEALAIWYAEVERKRLSNVNDWQYSLNWIRSVRHLVTPRAYSGFIMTHVSRHASLQSDWQVFWPLLWESIQLGKPRAFDSFLYLTMWLMPQELRQKLRAIAANKRQNTPQTSQ